MNKRPVIFPFFALQFFILLFLLFLALSLVPYIFCFTAAELGRSLGFSPLETFFLLFLILFGGMINIPIKEYENPQIYTEREVFSFFGIRYRVPQVSQNTVLAINVGGALIPSLIAIYFLIISIPKIPFIITLVAVILVTNRSAKVVKGVGITLPMFITPLVTVLISLFLSYIFECPMELLGRLSFSAGVLGVLIGADLLNLKKIRGIGSRMVSIGGAGTFDGIFLTGVISALLSLIFLL